MYVSLGGDEGVVRVSITKQLIIWVLADREIVHLFVWNLIVIYDNVISSVISVDSMKAETILHLTKASNSVGTRTGW